jgi:hypothetical protein
MATEVDSKISTEVFGRFAGCDFFKKVILL